MTNIDSGMARKSRGVAYRGRAGGDLGDPLDVADAHVPRDDRAQREPVVRRDRYPCDPRPNKTSAINLKRAHSEGAWMVVLPSSRRYTPMYYRKKDQILQSQV